MPDLKHLSDNLRTLSLMELEDFRKTAEKEIKDSINVDAFTEKLDMLYDEDHDAYSKQVFGLAGDKELSSPLRMAISSHVNGTTIPDDFLRYQISLKLLDSFSQNEEKGFEFLDNMSKLSETFSFSDLDRLKVDKRILEKLPSDNEQSFMLQESAFRRISTYETRTFEDTTNIAVLESLQKHPPNRKDEEKLLSHLERIGDKRTKFDDPYAAAQIDIAMQNIAETLLPDNARKIQEAVKKRLELYEFSDLRSAVEERNMTLLSKDWTNEAESAIVENRELYEKFLQSRSADNPGLSTLEFDAGPSTAQGEQPFQSVADQSPQPKPSSIGASGLGDVAQAEPELRETRTSSQAPSPGRSASILADASDCVNTILQTGKEAAAWAVSCGRRR